MGMSGLHLISLVLFVLLFVFPISKILSRIGFSGWWSLLALVPLVNIIALWVFAFMEWPSGQGRQRHARSACSCFRQWPQPA